MAATSVMTGASHRRLIIRPQPFQSCPVMQWTWWLLGSGQYRAEFMTTMKYNFEQDSVMSLISLVPILDIDQSLLVNATWVVPAATDGHAAQGSYQGKDHVAV
jgi:hypothetical protein